MDRHIWAKLAGRILVTSAQDLPDTLGRQWPKKKEDKEEEAEGSDEEYEESESSLRATLVQMQIRQTQYLDALADI